MGRIWSAWTCLRKANFWSADFSPQGGTADEAAALKRRSVDAFWHPFGMRISVVGGSRGYRCAQPPATIWHPFGMAVGEIVFAAVLICKRNRKGGQKLAVNENGCLIGSLFSYRRGA